MCIVYFDVVFTLFSKLEIEFSSGRIGKDIYGIKMAHFKDIQSLENPQIIIVVASPDGKIEIQEQLKGWNKEPVKDYWFFA